MQFKCNLGWYIIKGVTFFLRTGKRVYHPQYNYLLLSHCTFLISKQNEVFIIEVIDKLLILIQFQKKASLLNSKDPNFVYF